MTLMSVLFIPDRVLFVVRMKFFEFFRVYMPEGSVNSTFCVFTFLVMGKWTPPVFNDLYQIGCVPEECHAQRAIMFAVEDPEKPVVCRMKPGDVDNGLRIVVIAMRYPGRNEIPIRFYLHATDIFQVRLNQKNTDDYERYRCNNGEIDKRNSQNYFPQRLSGVVTPYSDSIHMNFCSPKN